MQEGRLRKGRRNDDDDIRRMRRERQRGRGERERTKKNEDEKEKEAMAGARIFGSSHDGGASARARRSHRTFLRVKRASFVLRCCIFLLLYILLFIVSFHFHLVYVCAYIYIFFTPCCLVIF